MIDFKLHYLLSPLVQLLKTYLNTLLGEDFESLTGLILEEKDFDVTKNLILTKPRMEIDVIGKKMGIALLIDCKHWKTMSKSALDEIVKKQIERVKRYVADESMSALPVIVTLHQEEIQFVDNVPIVPIMKLSSFLDEFVGNLRFSYIYRKIAAKNNPASAIRQYFVIFIVLSIIFE